MTFYFIVEYNVHLLEYSSRVRYIRGFESRMGMANDINIGICGFHAKHTTLRCKNKDKLARNQDNRFEWSNMSNQRLLFQCVSSC